MKTATDYLKLVFKVHSISSSSLAMLEPFLEEALLKLWQNVVTLISIL